LSKGNYDDARDSLLYVASINGQENVNSDVIVFKQEIITDESGDGSLRTPSEKIK
jgi:hypothetical protein